MKYQERELNGIRVISPQKVRSRTEPILISSRGFKNEIHDQIRNRLLLPNPVILLYPPRRHQCVTAARAALTSYCGIR